MQGHAARKPKGKHPEASYVCFSREVRISVPCTLFSVVYFRRGSLPPGGPSSSEVLTLSEPQNASSASRAECASYGTATQEGKASRIWMRCRFLRPEPSFPLALEEWLAQLPQGPGNRR